MAEAAHSMIDPFDAQFLREPYSDLETLRAAAPVVYLDRYDVWAFARHAECAAILADPATFCSGRGVGLNDIRKEEPSRLPGGVLRADPPLHNQTHSALMKVLSRTAIEILRDKCKSIANELVDVRFGSVASRSSASPSSQRF